MAVHPSAMVDPGARIAGTAEIGPYCIVGHEVRIGAGTRLMAHVYMEGPLEIGEDNIFYPYSTVGVASQDLKYRGERTETRVGSRNKIREFVTIHRGTEGGGALTAVGDDSLLMAYVHVAHDVQVGNHVVLANAVTLGGHVIVGDWAVIGSIHADGTGMLSFRDAAVQAGARYEYRIGVQNPGGLQFYGDTWVSVPVSDQLAIQRVSNPIVGDLKVSFTLPRSEPATIQLLDVSGRTVESVRVTASGQASLSGNGLTSGVYWVKLTQGARTAMARTVYIK